MVMVSSITLCIVMDMLCLFEGNFVGISLIRQGFLTTKDFKDFLWILLESKRIFARGVRDLLGINEMLLCKLLHQSKLSSFQSLRFLLVLLSSLKTRTLWTK